MKLFYFHVPKTAGTSLNQFISQNIPKHHFHIESVESLNKKFCEEYNFLSGHVSYNRMNKITSLKEWITFATFREPVSYVISHLKWVKKLSEKGEEERFESHPKIFQKISMKMREYDFSKPSEISEFIQWVESINFFYFHNTQLHYMNQTSNQGNLSKNQIDKAIENLKKIDFIGIQEELDVFMDILSDEFGWSIDEKPHNNINTNNFGLDINNKAIVDALFPLYKQDMLMYEEAKKMFNQQTKLYLKEGKKVIGFVDKINNGEIIGWARYKDSLKKVKVSLFINGEKYSETIANIYRNGLKIKGIHPTGLCEFRFTIDPTISSSSCVIIIESNNHKLPLSSNTSNLQG